MAVFLVGGVKRLVNFVRDLCLLFFCVKYDSYLITGFIVQRAHFQNQVNFTRYRFILGRQLFQVKNLPVLFLRNLIGKHFGQGGIQNTMTPLKVGKSLKRVMMSL